MNDAQLFFNSGNRKIRKADRLNNRGHRPVRIVKQDSASGNQRARQAGLKRPGQEIAPGNQIFRPHFRSPEFPDKGFEPVFSSDPHLKPHVRRQDKDPG